MDSRTKASIKWSPQTFQLHCNLARTSNLTWHQYLIWSNLALAKMLDLCRDFLINVLNKTYLITVSKLSKTQTFHIHVVKNKTLTLFSSVQDFRACIKKMLIINLTLIIRAVLSLNVAEMSRTHFYHQLQACFLLPTVTIIGSTPYKVFGRHKQLQDLHSSSKHLY